MRFKHSGDAGDVIYSLPTVIAFLRELNRTRLATFYAEFAHIYLEPSERDAYFGGGHFTEEKIAWLIPLLKSQPYVDKMGDTVRLWSGEEVDVDLNTFRKLPIDHRKGCLARFYFWAHPVFYDLAQPWLFVPDPIPNDYILVNRSFRYRNPSISYSFLRAYKNVGFLGYAEEFEDFKKEVPNAVCFTVDNALELAQFMAGCKCFIGNQSFCFSVAEALKVKRLLEVCPACPNVMPYGRGGFDAVNQIGFESAFKLMTQA